MCPPRRLAVVSRGIMKIIQGKHYERREYPQTPTSPAYMELELKPPFFTDIPTKDHAGFLDKIKKKCSKSNVKFEYIKRGESPILRLTGLRTVKGEDSKMQWKWDPASFIYPDDIQPNTSGGDILKEMKVQWTKIFPPPNI